MFFWNSCFFYDPADVGNLISGSSAFSKTSLNIWTFEKFGNMKNIVQCMVYEYDENSYNQEKDIQFSEC